MIITKNIEKWIETSRWCVKSDKLKENLNNNKYKKKGKYTKEDTKIYVIR